MATVLDSVYWEVAKSSAVQCEGRRKIGFDPCPHPNSVLVGYKPLPAGGVHLKVAAPVSCAADELLEDGRSLAAH